MKDQKREKKERYKKEWLHMKSYCIQQRQMSCSDKLALTLAVLCEKYSMALLWPTSTEVLTLSQSNRMLVDILTVLDNTQLVSNHQLLYGREWARSYSEIWQEILHSRLNAEIMIGQVPGCAVDCYYPYHASTCQLRLVCSRTKGRKDLSSVGLSAEFCNLLDLSATFNLCNIYI